MRPNGALNFGFDPTSFKAPNGALKEAWMPTPPHGREGLILDPCKMNPRAFFPSGVICVSRARVSSLRLEKALFFFGGCAIFTG